MNVSPDQLPPPRLEKKRQFIGEVTMKLVKSLLTSTAFAAALLSTSLSWGQCCGGASYDTVAAAAPASGCGCSYTVMKTVQRTINEQQQVTRYRTVNETVYDTQQVPETRNVCETKYRTENYTVQRLSLIHI